MPRCFKTPLLAIAALTTLAALGCTSEKRADNRERAAASEAQRTIRVGAWNIEWLGNPDRRSGPARDSARTPENIAEYILAANVDILGLAEIKIDNETHNTNATIAEALEIVTRRRGGNWTHILFPATYGTRMCCGVAWDQSRVSLIGGPIEVSNPGRDSSQGRSLWSRKAVACYFSAGEGYTDFIVVPVHMKSNYGGNFSTHRGEEAAILVADLPETTSDPDVLIVGDFNCAAHSEQAIQTLCNAGFVDLNAADISTFWRPAPLDRIFVASGQPEFERHHFEVLADNFWAPRGLTKADFKRDYSDHFMVITEIDVMTDDD